MSAFGAKRTLAKAASMSACDPQRTARSRLRRSKRSDALYARARTKRGVGGARLCSKSERRAFQGHLTQTGTTRAMPVWKYVQLLLTSTRSSRRKRIASHSRSEPSRSHTRSRRLDHQSRTRRNYGCGIDDGSGRESGYCSTPCDRSNPEHVRHSSVL